MGVVSIVAVAVLARRIGLAAPFVLVIAGIGLSWIPGSPQVDPELILAGVLPLLLYAAALRMPVVDLRRDIKAISLLAFVLVVATTLSVGLLVDAALPGLGLPGSFALGAALGPTDAVAATSIGRRLGLPSRLLVILEGEGLINDASSLVLLRSAVAAVAASVSVWHVAGDFVYAVAVAVAMGWVVGHLAVAARARLHDAQLTTAVSFAVPFAAFLPTEALHASGVLAVVVAGLTGGQHDPEVVRASDRLAESVNWGTISFLLESAVFLLMGLQLRGLLDEVDAVHASVETAVGLGALVALVILAVRLVFVAPLVMMLAKESERAEELEPAFEKIRREVGLKARVAKSWRVEGVLHKIDRKSADAAFAASERLGWRAGVVLGWAGMRGAITVAAAQSLPEDFPLRPQVLLVAFTAALLTLLVPGLSLPTVIRALKVPGDDPQADRKQLQDLLDSLALAAKEELAAARAADEFPDDVLDQVQKDLLGPLESAGQERGGDGPADRDDYVNLTTRTLAAERRALLAARAGGRYSTRVLRQVERRLDQAEGRMQQLTEMAE